MLQMFARSFVRAFVFAASLGVVVAGAIVFLTVDRFLGVMLWVAAFAGIAWALTADGKHARHVKPGRPTVEQLDRAAAMGIPIPRRITAGELEELIDAWSRR